MKKGFMFLSGLLVGAVLFGAAASFGAVGMKNITAEYSDIKMVVEGKLVKSELEPFLYNGRVYVPLRTAAEAMGKAVGWENNTVLIDNDRASLLLTDLLFPSESSVICSKGVSSSNVAGTSYDRSFYVTGKDSPSGTLSFFVQGRGIKQISGQIGVDDSNNSDKAVQLTILKDSEIIWEGSLKKGEKPVPMDITLDADTSNIYFKFNNVAKMKVDFIDFLGNY